jgi:hypothetical protein
LWCCGTLRSVAVSVTGPDHPTVEKCSIPPLIFVWKGINAASSDPVHRNPADPAGCRNRVQVSGVTGPGVA